MYKPRLSKEGMKDSPYWNSDEYNFKGTELRLPNCTAYCLGRSSEIANKNVKREMFPSNIPNAVNWFTENKWEKGEEAKLGAIAVWGGTYGHVAIVEKINSDGSVTVSQSNYDDNKSYDNPKYFEVKTYKNVVDKKTSGVGLTFLGYIYNPYVEENMEIIEIKKEKGYEYKWSVDGNKYGDKYDITTMGGFGDTKLKEQGYEEVLAVNGGLFYTYDNKHYACGLEKSRGINNQELEMTAVSDYKDCMAIACVDGELWFGRQHWIIDNKLEQCYGAITGLGLIIGGKKCDDTFHKGFESQWKQKSGRTIIGEKADGTIVSYSFEGETGKSGLTGSQAQEKCLALGLENAIMLDGGGSVWRRINGVKDITTTRKVKNALILYRRKIDDKPIEKPTDDYNNLLIDYRNLEDEYNSLEVKYNDKVKECDSLADRLVDMEKQYDDLLNKVESVKEILK